MDLRKSQKEKENATRLPGTRFNISSPLGPTRKQKGQASNPVGRLGDMQSTRPQNGSICSTKG